MWNRVRPIFLTLIVCLLFGCGSSVAYAAQVPEASVDQPAPNQFSQFAGTWYAHGASMVISNDGRVNFEARTYTWCSTQGPQPCDTMQDNHIFAGYHEQLALTRANDSSATGTVISSNDPTDQPHLSVTLTLGPNNTLIYAHQSSITVLCGPDAPAGACGA